MPSVISSVFMNGNCQAIRIPQEFRLAADRVEITRNEQGDLIIRPVPADRGAAVLEALAGFGDEYTALLEEDRRDPAPLQDRDGV